MPAFDPTERALISRAAAHTRWGRTTDRAAALAPARKGMMARFEREVDPDGTLDPKVRATLAESARKAYFTRLALKSHQARRAAALTKRLAAGQDVA